MTPPVTPRLRLTIIGVLIVCLFAALFTRLWYLQVLDSPRFVELSKRNEIRVVCEPAPRGLIRDRHGQVLVANRVTTAVTVSRAAVREQPVVLDRLSALLELPVDQLRKRVEDPRYDQLKPVPVAVDVEPEKLLVLKERSDDFPDVDTIPLATRTYPMGRLASHVLGYTGPISQAELEKLAPDGNRVDGIVDPEAECDGYQRNDDIGKDGVEKTFDRVLRGRPGVVVLEVDRNGKKLAEHPIRPPQQGADLILSIDADLQRVVEDSLRQGLERAKALKESNERPIPLRAGAGAAVVTDVRTGAVLAMASYPDYDPQDFIGGISTTAYQAYTGDPNKPLNNRAIQGLYAPASTFKLPVAIAALQKGVIGSANHTIVDTGTYRISDCNGPGCVFRNARSTPYGRINLPAAITVSSDVYFYDIGARFWASRGQYGETGIQDTARSLGLGQRTGIALPGEAEGRVSDPHIRRRFHELRPDAFPEGRWFTGDNVVMAIGQGETVVTPLQQASYYATFANGGTVYQARIAERAVNPDGTVAQQYGPVPKSTVDLPPEIRDPILQGLRNVVASPSGTASAAFRGYRGIPVAGKTGTAQVQGKQDYALFTGFAPSAAPQYAVSVVLEEGGFGGTTAAPVAKRVFEHLSGQPPGEVNLGSSSD